MMHDSSCGCADCMRFHPSRFDNLGQSSRDEATQELTRLRRIEKLAGELKDMTLLGHAQIQNRYQMGETPCPCEYCIKASELEAEIAKGVK